MPEPQVIDPQSIENLRSLNPGDGDAFLREVVSIYLEDTPKRIAELDQSLAAGDRPKFTRAAHSIKGSSANLGALSVRAAAEILEHRSAQQGLDNLAAPLADLKAEFDRAKLEFDRLLPPA